MGKIPMNSKKDQQLNMSIVESIESPEFLTGMTLKVIEIREDWKSILNFINEHQHIQRAMEKAYQNY